MFVARWWIPVSLAVGMCAFAASAAAPVQTFTYQGRFLDGQGYAPLSGAVDLTFTILPPEGSECVLYEETVMGLDLNASLGFFTAQVGSSVSGDDHLKRTALDPGFTMGQVFSNASSLSNTSSSCVYTPSAGDGRRLRVTVSRGGQSVTLTPDQKLSSVPFASNSESLQGKVPSDFVLQSDTRFTALTNGSDVSSLTTALHHHDSRYVLKGTGFEIDGSGKAILPASSSSYAGADAKNVCSVGYVQDLVATKESPLSFSAPLGRSGNTVSLPSATSVASGYLTNTDWITFNGKQDAGNYLTGLTGDVSASGPGNVTTTVSKVNGGPIPISATLIGTNASGQLIAQTGSIANNTSGTAANLAGTPALPNGTTATTQTSGDNSTKLATTAYVDTGLSSKQNTLTNPITGTSTANYWPYFSGATTLAGVGISASKVICSDASGRPTECTNLTDSTAPSASSSNPLMDGTAAPGSATAYARADHVHPTDTSLAPKTSPAFTGNVTMPGTGIWNSSGSVGIGTTDPQAPLQVTGAIRSSGLLGGLQVDSRNGVGSNFIWYVPTNGTSLRLYDTASSSDKFTIKSDGSVGIGTTSPQAMLDVSGTFLSKSYLETTATQADSGTAYTIPDATLNLRLIRLTGNATITLPTAPSTANTAYNLTIKILQDSTGSRTLSWAAPSGDSIKWDGGAAAAPASAAGKESIYQFTRIGTVWYGSLVWKEG